MAVDEKDLLPKMKEILDDLQMTQLWHDLEEKFKSLQRLLDVLEDDFDDDADVRTPCCLSESELEDEDEDLDLEATEEKSAVNEELELEPTKDRNQTHFDEDEEKRDFHDDSELELNEDIETITIDEDSELEPTEEQIKTDVDEYLKLELNEDHNSTNRDEDFESEPTEDQEKIDNVMVTCHTDIKLENEEIDIVEDFALEQTEDHHQQQQLPMVSADTQSFIKIKTEVIDYEEEPYEDPNEENHVGPYEELGVDPYGEPNVLRCHLCDKFFNQNSLLRRHQATTHFRKQLTDLYGTENRICRMCGKKFSEQRRLWSHLANEHEALSQFVECSSQYLPQQNPPNKVPKKKNSAKPKLVRKPYKVRKEKKPSSFQCHKCAKAFDSHKKLLSHLSITHYWAFLSKRFRNVDNRCNICGKSYHTPNGLIYHAALSHDALKGVIPDS